MLASERNCIEIEPGSGGDAFSWRKRDKGAAGRTAKYTNGADPGGGAQEPALWVQPLRWMDGVVDSVQGKIDCPGYPPDPRPFNSSTATNRCEQSQAEIGQIDLKFI